MTTRRRYRGLDRRQLTPLAWGLGGLVLGGVAVYLYDRFSSSSGLQPVGTITVGTTTLTPSQQASILTPVALVS
jgi:hypothetical protein